MEERRLMYRCVVRKSARVEEVIPMLLLLCDKLHQHALEGLIKPLVKAISLQLEIVHSITIQY